MGKGVLDISSAVKLPLEYVTQTGAILARRGAGKTYTALKIAEEMADNGLPFVAIDPTGVMWGLRSSASGEQTGWPIIILGGEHADIPLEPTSGKLIAEFVVESGTSVILDLSQFEKKAEENRFLHDFAERLYRLKGQGHREPLHLLLDEADQYIPQRVGPDMTHLVGAFERIVKLGRSRGLGMTMITQRPATLNKNVLTQAEVLMIFQITSPQDRKAIMEWVDGNASAEESKEVLASLAALQQGEGWLWSPGWLKVLEKVQISKRRTFDSSRTPEHGQVREPKKVAPVDLVELGARMTDTIEKMAENDPAKLKMRIRDLERELKDIANREAEVQVIEKVVEVVPAPILEMVKRLEGKTSELVIWSNEIIAAAEEVGGDTAVLTVDVDPMPEPRVREVRSFPTVASGHDLAPAIGTESEPFDDQVKLGKAEKLILRVAALEANLTRAQVGLRAGYAASGGGFGNALSNLRTSGLIYKGDAIRLTAAGNELALQPHVEAVALMVGEEILEFWKTKAHGKAEKLIVQALYDFAMKNGGDWTMTRDEIAAATGYESSGGGFGNALSKVNTMGLIDSPIKKMYRIHPDLLGAILR